MIGNAGEVNAGDFDPIEELSVRWLRELFELPDEFGGVLVTGATMANFTCLAAARNWWAEQHGLDVERDGLSGAPRVPVVSSGYLHPSAAQALGMLGIGRAVGTFAKDSAGRLDAEALDAELERLDGAPAIVIGNAGEVNAGAPAQAIFVAPPAFATPVSHSASTTRLRPPDFAR